MSSSSAISTTILLFQNLYIGHYPFNYKPSIVWVVKKGELRMKKVVRRRKSCHQLMDLIPLLVCFQSMAIKASSIILLFKIKNLVIWKSSRFWGWLVFATASAWFGFIYNMIAIGHKRDLFLHICSKAAYLEEEMRMGMFQICKILCKFNN